MLPKQGVNSCLCQLWAQKVLEYCSQVDFAIEMKAKLDEINKHSFNSFQLRIGKTKPLCLLYQPFCVL